MVRPRANQLTDEQIAVLAYFTEARYASRGNIAKWPKDFVDKFRGPLQQLVEAYNVIQVGEDSAGQYIIPSTQEQRDDFKAKYISLLGVLQTWLPSEMKKTPRPDVNDPLGEQVKELEIENNFEFSRTFHSLNDAINSSLRLR